MILYAVTESTTEPLSLNDVKSYLRLSTDDISEDSMLKSLITLTRIQAENLTGRSLVRKTLRQVFDEFPNDENSIELLRGVPLSSSATDLSITYVDSTGGSATLSSTVYTIDSESVPPRVYLSYDQTYPTARDQKKAVTLSYVAAGYTTGTLPPGIKSWMTMKIIPPVDHADSLGLGPVPRPSRIPGWPRSAINTPLNGGGGMRRLV